MSAIGRNEPCRCGSGKKTKRCCGIRPKPSETELAWAFLAEQAGQAALRLFGRSSDARHELFDAMLDLPGQHFSLQVPLPRLFPPELELLRGIVEASDELVHSALVRVDSPQTRAGLARTVDHLAACGTVDRAVADCVLVDLDRADSAFITMSLLHALSVMVGVTRTPSGLVVATC